VPLERLLWKFTLGFGLWASCWQAIFIFLYFRFLQKIYFCFRNLQKYTPAAPLPGGCEAAGVFL